MSLEHILIGMLREEPSSGYDLKRAFSEGARHFWYAELSQIYPTLSRMEEKGLLYSEVGESTRGPKRRVYHVTPKGFEELKRWLTDGQTIGAERFPYIAKMYFFHELDDYEQTMRYVQSLRDGWSHKLAFLENVERSVVTSGEHDPKSRIADFHLHAALRLGIHQLRAKLSWSDETLQNIQERLAAAANRSQAQPARARRGG